MKMAKRASRRTLGGIELSGVIQGIVLSFLLLAPGLASAATRYLDNGSTNCSTPSDNDYDPTTRTCGSGSDTVYAAVWAAGQATKSGDTLIIMPGVYWDATGSCTGQWYWGSMNLVTSNVTVEGYNGQQYEIRGGSSSTDVLTHPCNALHIGASNIIVRDMKTYGGFVFAGSGNLVEKCELTGGWDHQGTGPDAGWPTLVRYYNSGGNTLQNCYLHDNQQSGFSGNAHNMAMIVFTNGADSEIIQNNEFYNPKRGFIYCKRDFENGLCATVRYNIFRGCDGNCIAAGDAMGDNDLIVHNNIMIGTGADDWFFQGGISNFSFKIYNNTFYNVGSALWTWSLGASDTPWDFFNNIIYNNTGGRYIYDFDQVVNYSNSYMNYNNPYSTVGVQYRFSGKSYSFSSWQANSGKDANSVTTNPNFLNGSGTFSQPSDFKRSSYPANGRGGAWPSVMGAYITGNEVIGPVSGSLPPPDPAPSPPTGVTVQ